MWPTAASASSATPTPGAAPAASAPCTSSPTPSKTSTADDPASELHNGDGLCYHDLQKELVGLQINRAEPAGAKGVWKLWPKDPMDGFKDLRKGVVVNRNRDMRWVRTLEKKSAERHIGVWLSLNEVDGGLQLSLTDEDGHSATAQLAGPLQRAKDPGMAETKLREQLDRFGNTIFAPRHIDLHLSQPWFVPASQLNTLRRDAVAGLEAARRRLATTAARHPSGPTRALPRRLAELFGQRL